MADPPITVAVVGLGAFGLVTVKNLTEEGFKVTAFDSKPYIGGLWCCSEGSQTSVLPSTVTNVSKYRGCFTDFAYPEDVTEFPMACEVAQYLEDYADNFGLRPMFRLTTPVQHVAHDSRKSKWAITLEKSAEVLYFDKVVVATGVNNRPSIPRIEGFEKFRGESLHSRDYKGPKAFEGKRVVVVGLGNSGADISTPLVGYAKEVYVSHRAGAYIITRYVDGKPFDHALTLRMERARGVLERVLPCPTEVVFNKYVERLQNRSFEIREEWGLSPAPSLKFSMPVISDTVVSCLESGRLVSVPGIKEFTGPGEVVLDDGGVLHVDAIVWCTGYTPDFSFLDPQFDPTAKSPAAWNDLQGSRGRPLPRLYKNIFSLERPESLAFIGYVAFPSPAFQTQDLASMALAQIWKGNSKLPSARKMQREVEVHEGWMCKLARRGRVHPAWVSWSEWVGWANRTAGTGLAENLGWGVQGWRFWAGERDLYRAVVDGVYSPHLYRLFETGKRKRWDGAAEEIFGVNEKRRGKDVGEKSEETRLLCFGRLGRRGCGVGRDTA